MKETYHCNYNCDQDHNCAKRELNKNFFLYGISLYSLHLQSFFRHLVLIVINNVGDVQLQLHLLIFYFLEGLLHLLMG
jgi:hypothetical protein